METRATWRSKHGKAVSLALRGAVLVAAAVFLARGVRWSDVASALDHASLPLLAAVVAINAVMMGVKALRLRLLLRPGEAGPGICFLALLTSSAINNVTPLRGGDVARLFMLQRHARVTKAAAIAVTVVEKGVELCALAVAASLGAWIAAGEAWARIAGPVAVAATVVLLLALRLTARRSVATRGTVGLRGRVAAWLARVEPGTRGLAGRGVLAGALALSFVGWACEATMVCLAARAVGIHVGAPLALVTLFGVNLAIALPSAPASAGPFEGAMVLVLMLAGVAKGKALAFALLYHVVLVVPVTVAGLLVVSRAGVTLGEPEPARELAAG